MHESVDPQLAAMKEDAKSLIRTVAQDYLPLIVSTVRAYLSSAGPLGSIAAETIRIDNDELEKRSIECSEALVDKTCDRVENCADGVIKSTADTVEGMQRWSASLFS